ncbi:carbohydrate ABC transporter permease [Prosthecomicrobium pneumaticum]|uniref:Multiple sugar transport system permease protein n=1 Tax=Prosthecomicrobium pneumaticum TaxID=81895 RepID=A0A7W9CVS1_9HYPH|nr:sugar ABC transporter permease [Prosthecomicrobium pneumaticum]MBB5752436.1 multiple sugar transport system permease protein [Prosthecomicrobium pneumaticum]
MAAKTIGLDQGDKAEARVFLAGLCVFLALMLGFPTLANLWYSFSDVSFQNLASTDFVGLRHYADAVANPRMWTALGFSVRFALLTTAIEVGIGLVLVFVLHPLLTKRPWLTGILMLPMMVSPALMGVMYRLILNEFTGLVPGYLELVGISMNFLGRANVYATLVAIEVLQWTPFAFLILLTARQGVAYELEEAAAVDGATGLRLFLHVILPIMLPAIAIVAFIRFIDGFRVFDHIFVLTGGGPGTQTTSISIHIYKLFFVQNRLGEAVALSVMLLVAALALLYFGLKLVVRRTAR